MSDIILYTTDDGVTKIDLRLEDGTVWLSQLQIADLFSATKQNISLHLKNIFEDEELSENSVVKESLTTAADDKSYRTKLYNLEAILAVGYRVRSPRGSAFRRYDSILNSTGRKLLDNAGTISSSQAQEKAKRELQRYKTITLDQVEKDYLKTISSLEKQAKKESRKKGDKP